LVANLSPCKSKKNCKRSGEFFSYISSFEPYLDAETETKVTGFKIKIAGNSERSMGEVREEYAKS